MDDGAPIREFVMRAARLRSLDDDEDLFASGFVNSLFAAQLVDFVERRFGIAVSDEDLDLANFRSVAAIADLVRRKLEAVPAQGSR